MLQSLREKFMGWPGVIIFGGLGLLMAVAFGVGSYSVSNLDTWVAKAGDYEISQQDFQTQMNNLRRQMSAQQDNQFDASYFQKPEVKRQVVQSMIDRHLLQKSGDDIGLVVTQQAVRQQIATTPAFQVNGKFDANTYQAVLTNSGLTPVGYQQKVQADLQTKLLPDTVAATATVGPQEVADYLRLQLQTRDLAYVVLPRPALTDTKVDEQEVAAYYKAHQDAFMIPERVAVRYIELDASKLDVSQAITKEALLARYEQEKSRFVQPDQRLVSHILIDVPDNATPEQQKAALAEATKVDKLAHAKGADFAALAKKYSDDAGSSILGGELGWLQEGVTAKAFNDAVFAMHKGEISQPVLGPEGYHIIWLRGVRKGEVKPFAEVESQLRTEVQTTDRARKFSKIAGELTDQAYQNPASLEPAADKLGLKIQSTKLFSRDGTDTGLAAHADVVKAAFSDNVLKDGNTSDPIRLGANHIVLIHVSEHKKATPKPLDSVSAEIRQKILDERVDQRAKTRADTLLAKLKKSHDLTTLAKAEKLPVRKLEGAQRAQQGVSAALLDEAFKLPHPDKDQPSVGLVALDGGSYALVAVQAVHPGDVDKVPELQQKMLLTQMRNAYGALATQAWLSDLKAHTDVKIAADRL